MLYGTDSVTEPVVIRIHTEIIRFIKDLRPGHVFYCDRIKIFNKYLGSGIVLIYLRITLIGGPGSNSSSDESSPGCSSANDTGPLSGLLIILAFLYLCVNLG